MSGKDLAQALEPDVPQEEIDQATEDVPAETPEVAEEERSSKQKEAEDADPAAKAKKIESNHLKALQEERKKRQEAESLYRQNQVEQERKNAILQDRLNQLWQQQSPGPQLRDPKTDPDPLDALQHNQQLTQQAMQEMYRRQQTDEARQRQEAAKANLIGWARSQAAQFAQENEDFGQAYSHVLSNRKGELEAMGLGPDQIAETLHNDELWVYQTAAQSGKNPAEIIYHMAKNTGFKRVDPPQPKEVAEQKIETLQRGVAASRDLSGGAVGKPTAEQIANMSDEEFSELKAKLKKQGKNISDVI